MMPSSLITTKHCIAALCLLLAAFCLLLSAFCFLPSAFTAQQSPEEVRIAAGKKIFGGACSNSYCHGSAGTGGGGPKLQNRNLTAEYVIRIVNEGVKGTGMPAFKSAYNQEEIAAIVAYVGSLSPGQAGEKSGVDPHFNSDAGKNAAKPENKGDAATTTPKAMMTASDLEFLKGSNAAAGRALFFDPAVADTCRACHTVNERGGKVGPDLTSIGSKSAEEIFQRILNPHSALTPKYETIALTTRNGERLVGVKRDEDAETIRLYDTSSMPPISRAVAKAEIVKSEKLTTSAMPDNYGKKYSRQQLLDLVAFLKAGE